MIDQLTGDSRHCELRPLSFSEKSQGPVGHTFVSFIFDNAPRLSISIESGPETGEGLAPAVRIRIQASSSPRRSGPRLNRTPVSSMQKSVADTEPIPQLRMAAKSATKLQVKDATLARPVSLFQDSSGVFCHLPPETCLVRRLACVLGVSTTRLAQMCRGRRP